MSGFFPAPPKLAPVWKSNTTDGSNWYLLEPFAYNADVISSIAAHAILVPAGFITDFASTPRPIWNIYPPWGTYGPAAIVHDWLYWNQATTRDYADNVLLQAMHALGCDPVTCKAIYEAVALAGQFAWDGNAKQKATGYTRMVAIAANATEEV